MPQKSEKETPKFQKPAERDEWMNLTSLCGLYSNKEERKEKDESKRKEKEASKYNPKTSVRELNPYWKDGGEGLPTAKTKFMRPPDDDYNSSKYVSKGRSSNWRKRSPKRDDYRRRYDKNDDERHEYQTETYKRSYNKNDDRRNRSRESSPNVTIETKSYKSEDIIYESKEVFTASDKLKSENSEVKSENSEPSSSGMLTDKEMNDLAAKIVKAEILGNTSRVRELKEKLEKARELRNNPNATVTKNQDEEVLLTRTDAKGFSKPLDEKPAEYSGNKRKKVNTHDLGKRQKYYPDDGKYSLTNMFESEKFGSAAKQDEEFMKAASKLSKSDDLDDMFMDNIRKKESDEKSNRKERDRAIWEHKKMSQTLDDCKNCIQSSSMLKHLMVTLGETVFLSLPPYDPITEGHCLLIPIRHVSCSTQLDENEWAEILDFRKALTNMFKSENRNIIFYETAVNFHSYPHMIIHCVPLPEEQGDLAPIYFKKGIDECETEWSTNKKLINMAGKDVRRSVPKGLPYFWVSFGMKEGFAHVIEEQKYFPKFFAEEIIGGIMDLHHSKWRRAAAQKFDVQKARVVEFSKNWTKYDCTVK